MTDRPSPAGSILGATVPGDAGAPGYYPDPSVPGFVRYWAGHAWVPGTSRSAPAPGEQLEPPRFVARYLTAPPYGIPPGYAPAPPAAPAETGPVYLDETGAQAAFTMSADPGPGPASGDLSSADRSPVDLAPGELELRPRAGMAALRPVEPTPWAVTGNGLQPASNESWATAAALRLDAPRPATAAVVGPRTGREVPAAARPLELPSPAPEPVPVSAPAPAPVAPAEAAVPRPAQPLGGTPWHGAGGREDSVGLAFAPPAEPSGPAPAGPAAPTASTAPVAPEAAAVPDTGAESGWRADPRAQRGLMETGGAPRWVSWGVDRETAPAEDPAPVPAPVPASDPASLSGAQDEREPRPAHVISERVRPPRRAETPASPAAPAASTPAAARVKRSRTAPPAPVPAPLGARVLGRLVDGGVTLAVGAAVAVPLVGTVTEHLRRKIEQARLAAELTGRQHKVFLLDQVVLGRVGLLLGVLLVFALLYQVVPISRTGQTFGKRLARVRVVGEGGTRPPGFGRSLLRWLVRSLGTVLLLGLVAPLFDRPAGRGWHDRAARTRVVRVERG